MNTSAAILGSLLLLVFATSAGASASAHDLNDAGKAAYSRGDYAAAERLFDQAVAQAPKDPLLHYHRGVTLMRLSRWREASAALEAVLRLSPPAELARAAQQGIRSLAPLLREPAPRSARGEETLVTLHRAGGNWIAEVRLNDSRTARFVVDTGASACVVSPELAAALGIDPGPRAETVPMQVVGGVTAGPRVTIASVRVGDAEVENVAAVIHSIGPGIDGLLGNTFLGRFTVTLDPDKGVLILRPR
ncbi:MAG: TIGR02281 family clan AA aspartic protease [Candidatus Rokuibacteriota bacterium]